MSYVDAVGGHEWWPVPGPVVEERGENYAATFPALYECPKCAAAVARGSVEKHAEWHRAFSAGGT